MLDKWSPRRVLLMSTPVGPIGSGMGGGVELTISNIAQELARRGHAITAIAPRGSRLANVRLIEADGTIQAYAQYQGREAPVILPPDSVLAAMWEAAGAVQSDHDLVLNLAYDWLPLYLTPFFAIPVLHLLSMSSLSDAMDSVVAATARRFPEYLAVHTRTQGQTFPSGDRLRILSTGLDLRLYPFSSEYENRLCWVGRIAPEKGLEDAAAVAARTGLPLDVCGVLQDEQYWQGIVEQYPEATLRYRGFFSTQDLAEIIGRSLALLLTPKWTEALGNVAIEALACGTPVITYGRGGPTEIVEHGRSGLIVEPDNIDELIQAVSEIKSINRHDCRRRAEQHFSLPALGDRLEAWFDAALPASTNVSLAARICVP